MTEKFEDTPQTLRLKRTYRNILDMAVDIYKLSPSQRTVLGDNYWNEALTREELKQLPVEERMEIACHWLSKALKDGLIRDALTMTSHNHTNKWVI